MRIIITLNNLGDEAHLKHSTFVAHLGELCPNVEEIELSFGMVAALAETTY